MPGTGPKHHLLRRREASHAASAQLTARPPQVRKFALAAASLPRGNHFEGGGLKADFTGHTEHRMLDGRWLKLAALVFVIFLGCSGKSERAKSSMTAGKASMTTGGGAGEDGEGGSTPDGVGGAHGGSPNAGQGGSSPAAGRGATAGGSGGSSGHGGSAGIAARAGGAGLASTGGAAGTGGSNVSAPAAWTCQATRYGDGKSCDCGCGAPDPDCKDDKVASCDVCSLLGGCGHAACPSNVVPGDNAHCALAPDWLCDAASYGDGKCDCGCGAVDIDCKSQQAASCDFCPLSGCANVFDCSTIDPDDNTVCTSAPQAWKCDARLYRDGAQCDCGCGFRDPDCSSKDIASCDSCDSPGACSHRVCPGTINPDSTALCYVPTPPPEWQCDASMYADAKICDCGCGAEDPDCSDNAPESCERCKCGFDCAAAVDPTDPTKCAPAPPGWTCAPDAYADFNCNCGCGVMDIDCIPDMYCTYCDGCANGYCGRIDQNDITKCIDRPAPAKWTCPQDSYFDGACDCGCGATDVDCGGPNKAACDVCDDPGSCSNLPCSAEQNPIKTSDNTTCSP